MTVLRCKKWFTSRLEVIPTNAKADSTLYLANWTPDSVIWAFWQIGEDPQKKQYWQLASELINLKF